VGRASEAVAQHRRALEEDPLNLVLRAGLAISLTSAGKDEEALAEARKILELDPNFVSACTLQTLNVTKAPLPEALAFAEKGFSLAPWNPITAGLLAGLLVRIGDRARAAELIGGDWEMGGPMRHRWRSRSSIYFLERPKKLPSGWRRRLNKGKPWSLCCC
jgi:tetratricopeptide (TPR) repeat protein